MRRLLVLLLAPALLVLQPAVAGAGTTSRWERLTTTNDPNTVTPALLRTPDGVLHAAWLRQEPASQSSLRHTAISRAGRLSASTDMVGTWSVLANPDLVPAANGMRVFFGGIRTTSSTEPNTEMNTATSDFAGNAWTLQLGSITAGEQGAADAGAAVLPDGTPFVSWGATLGVLVHRGTTPGPSSNFQPALGGCCGYFPDLARDGSTGQLMVAWFSNASGREGVWAQGVDAATGAPVGAPALMPGSATSFQGQGKSVQMVTRTPIAGRSGEPGVYVAYPGGYPAQDRVLLWRVGATRSQTLARSRNVAHDQVGIAAAPDGKLWAFWSEKQGARYRIVVARSNSRVTSFGERVVLRPPAGSIDDFHLVGDAQANRLDLFGSFGRASGVSTWHRQVLPGLTLKVRTRRLRRGGVLVTVTVTDAGRAVRGATVRVRGRRARTNRRGRARVRLRSAPRRFSVSAQKKGFVTDRARVRRRSG